MTAPVTARSSEGQMQSMGFLYENDVGSTGEAGGAEGSRPSIGRCPLACVVQREVICQWFGANCMIISRDGSIFSPLANRCMGYNSPFVHGFLKYAELQIEVSEKPQAELPAK